MRNPLSSPRGRAAFQAQTLRLDLALAKLGLIEAAKAVAADPQDGEARRKLGEAVEEARRLDVLHEDAEARLKALRGR